MPNVVVPQPISTYVIGDTWTPQWSIYVDGVLVDPLTVTVRVESPTPTDTDYTYPTSPTLVRSETGVYSLAVPMTVLGKWWARAKFTVQTSGGIITRYVEWPAWCVASKQQTPN